MLGYSECTILRVRGWHSVGDGNFGSSTGGNDAIIASIGHIVTGAARLRFFHGIANSSGQTRGSYRCFILQRYSGSTLGKCYITILSIDIRIIQCNCNGKLCIGAGFSNNTLLHGKITRGGVGDGNFDIRSILSDGTTFVRIGHLVARTAGRCLLYRVLGSQG